MSNTYPMQLTHLESLYLSDSISMFMQGPPDGLQGQVSPYPNLLLKIGGAVLETDQQNSRVSVCFNLSELWVIREVTKSSVVIGSERVGLSLLLKVYSGIRALAAESDMLSVFNAFGEVVDDEPGKSQYTSQLERIKDGGDLSTGGKLDEDSGNNQPNSPDQDRSDD